MHRDGRVVIDDADIKVKPGERVLLGGESGSGKSTLIRAIAGLWPWGEGRILLPAGAKLAFVPQRPYIPLGTLRDAIAYPVRGQSSGRRARQGRAEGRGPRLPRAAKLDTRRSAGTRRCRAASASASPSRGC